jgi:ribosomal protein L37AE/L43A
MAPTSSSPSHQQQQLIDLVDDSGDDALLPSRMKKKNRAGDDTDADDDDSSVEFVGLSSSASGTAAPAENPPKPAAAKRARIHKSTTAEMEDDEKEENRKPAAIVKKEKEFVASTKDKNNKDTGGLTRPEEDDADIQMIEAPHMVPEDPPPYVKPFASLADQDEKMTDVEPEDEDVAVIGTRNRIRLPHMRQHCTDHLFCIGHGKVLPQFVTRLQQNTAHCNLCYCYVCDVLADQCPAWATHCYATDAGPEAPYFKRLRQEKRLEKERSLHQPPTTKIAADAPLPGDSDISTDEKADDTVPHGKYQDTVCMHCKSITVNYSAICHALCEKCGRTVAKEHYKENQMAIKEDKLLLKWGTRDMPFRMVTRNFRKLEPYAQNWASHADEEAWKIDHEAEALDAFRRRVGYRPTLSAIMATLSPFRDENAIPESAHAIEHDAIFLDDPKEGSLLCALFACNSQFGSETTTPYYTKQRGFGGDISIVFDAKHRRGVSS